MDKHTLTDRVRQKAIQLGFHLIGFSKVERLEKEGTFLKRWNEKGYAASMHWLNSNEGKRIDPKKILPNIRSIISVGINYYTNISHSNDKNTGKISRYAWGDDYHQIIKERLHKLLDFMKEIEPITMGKIYIDTGSIMEKVWALRAGIGWQGKNSLIISKKYGSWILLGEIISNLELESDSPQTDLCGDCTLCLDSCPTDAIVEPHVLDARKCIAYITIEHRGNISYNEGKYFDNWIYGCDICQEVCPWNKKTALSTNIKEFYPHQENIKPNLSELVRISPNEFGNRFDNSPIKRLGIDRLKRNVRVALRNQQNK